MNTLFNQVAYYQILDRIDNLADSSESQWGKMTVNEMICHVSDPFRDLMGIRKVKPSIPFLIRPLAKLFLLSDKPFPKNAPTVNAYLQSPKGGGTKTKGFELDKEELKHLINLFVSKDNNFEPENHAAIGKLTRKEAAKFMWKHLDHHLRQFGV